MKMIIGIFVFVTIFAMASATKKGDDSLLSVLSKEREEMKDMLRDENKQLRQENTKMRQEDNQLRKQIVKLRDEKLQDEIARQKKQIQKLRHDDRRQRDHEDSIRQEDVVSETKKRESHPSHSSQLEAFAEVAFVNGSAHATSWLDNRYTPAKAFNPGSKDDTWHSGGDKHQGVFPKMIWYDFSIGNGFVPARITFQSGQGSTGYLSYTPSIWEFVGSNDDVCSKYSAWTILCRDYSGVKPLDLNAIKRCDVEGRAEKKFRCLGINILNNRYAFSAVSHIRMWRKA